MRKHKAASVCIPMTTREQKLLHAAYLGVRDAGLQPEDAGWMLKEFGAKEFGVKHAAGLKRKLAAVDGAMQKRLRARFRASSPGEIRAFCRRARQLEQGALEAVDATGGGFDKEAQLRWLKEHCPGFALQTYERAVADAWFSLR